VEVNGFEIEHYNVHRIKDNVKTSTCPECSHDRKPINQKQKCMSVFWDTGLGQCNHCGATVQLHTFKKKEKPIKQYAKPKPKNINSPYTLEFSKGIKENRGISESTLKRFKVTQEMEFMPQLKKEVSCIVFNYFHEGELINAKYRGAKKSFKLVSGAEKIFYNIDAIKTDKECIVVEGEFDALSFGECGVNNVVSVPNGFSAQGNINLDYLDDYYDYFQNKDKIYIATDNDEAGLNGQKELIKRFGAEKCNIVDFKDCKDANDYLVKYGVEELKKVLKDSKEVPLNHIETISNFESELDDFFINGCPKGYISGMNSLDNVYSIEDGQFCVITGTPQSGKSEVADSLAIGYAMKYGFKTAYCSPENKPNKFHSAKIVKKVLGYAPTNLSDEKYIQTKEFVNDKFIHIDYDNGYDLEKVLSKFEELVKRKGVKVFVIDPYNKVKLKGGSGDVNEYTNEYFNKIDVFCRKHQCLLYLVMHPVKMQKEEGSDTYKMANAYNIKGGGEVFDMSYHILTLRKHTEYKLVHFRTLKVKFQHLGKPDQDFYLAWNMNNGRYQEVDWNPEFDESREVDKWDSKFLLRGNIEDSLTEHQEMEMTENHRRMSQMSYGVDDEIPF
jgi:twinkle protein